jgi:hypothetical protein
MRIGFDCHACWVFFFPSSQSVGSFGSKSLLSPFLRPHSLPPFAPHPTPTSNPSESEKVELSTDRQPRCTLHVIYRVPRRSDVQLSRKASTHTHTRTLLPHEIHPLPNFTWIRAVNSISIVSVCTTLGRHDYFRDEGRVTHPYIHLSSF